MFDMPFFAFRQLHQPDPGPNSSESIRKSCAQAVPANSKSNIKLLAIRMELVGLVLVLTHFAYRTQKSGASFDLCVLVVFMSSGYLQI